MTQENYLLLASIDILHILRKNIWLLYLWISHLDELIGLFFQFKDDVMIEEIFNRFLICFNYSVDSAVSFSKVVQNSINLIFFKESYLWCPRVSLHETSIARELTGRHLNFLSKLIIFFTKYFHLQLFRIHGFHLATHTFKCLALLAMDIWYNYIIMWMVIFTVSTPKWQIIVNVIMSCWWINITSNRDFSSSDFLYTDLSSTFGSYYVLELSASNINISPYICQFWKRTKNASLNLIQIVVKIVGILCKFWLFSIDSKLYLSNKAVVKLYIDQYIISLSSKTIFYSNYLHFLWVFSAYSIKLVKNA